MFRERERDFMYLHEGDERLAGGARVEPGEGREEALDKETNLVCMYVCIYIYIYIVCLKIILKKKRDV